MAHCMGHKIAIDAGHAYAPSLEHSKNAGITLPSPSSAPTRQKNAGSDGPAYGVNAVYNIGVRAEARPVAWRGCRCPWSVHPCGV